MAVAALIISILAIAAAGASAWYTRSLAVEARSSTLVEAERRHDERAPTFTAVIESVNEGQPWHRLWLRLAEGKVDLTRVDVEVTEGDGVAFPPDQGGVDPRAGFPRQHASWPDGLRVGDRAAWRVDLPTGRDQRRPAQVRLRIRAAAGAEEWVSVLAVDVPVDPVTTVW